MSDERTDHLLLSEDTPVTRHELRVDSEHLLIHGDLARHVHSICAIDCEASPFTMVKAVPGPLLPLFVNVPDTGDEPSHWLTPDAMKFAFVPDRFVHVPVFGRSLTLYAWLTPLGAVSLTRGRDVAGAPLCAMLDNDVLDEQVMGKLQRVLANTASRSEKLRVFAAWIEAEVHARRVVPAQAVRAARIALRVRQNSRTGVQELADMENISRRQLERDFARHLNSTPKQFLAATRVQHAALLALRGNRLAEVAAELGYADQAHLTRDIRARLGISPGALLQAARQTVTTHLMKATGGLVYL